MHTSSGGASDIDQIGMLVDRYGDDVKIHLVHLGGGVSAHIKLIGSRLFDWIEAGKQVYTDTSWAVGFAPRWLVQEIERRGIGQDRLLFASDEPWGDYAGELARLRAATGDGELGRMVLRDNFTTLYGSRALCVDGSHPGGEGGLMKRTRHPGPPVRMPRGFTGFRFLLR